MKGNVDLSAEKRQLSRGSSGSKLSDDDATCPEIFDQSLNVSLVLLFPAANSGMAIDHLEVYTFEAMRAFQL